MLREINIWSGLLPCLEYTAASVEAALIHPRSSLSVILCTLVKNKWASTLRNFSSLLQLVTVGINKKCFVLFLNRITLPVGCFHIFCKVCKVCPACSICLYGLKLKWSVFTWRLVLVFGLLQCRYSTKFIISLVYSKNRKKNLMKKDERETQWVFLLIFVYWAQCQPVPAYTTEEEGGFLRLCNRLQQCLKPNLTKEKVWRAVLCSTCTGQNWNLRGHQSVGI